MTLYTTSQIAALLGISRERIRQLAQLRGVGQMYGHARLFTERDLANLRVKGGVGGRPRTISQGPAGCE